VGVQVLPVFRVDLLMALVLWMYIRICEDVRNHSHEDALDTQVG
jgi:hypothetical protein